MDDEQDPYILPLARLSMADVARVGGKNASLGEMIRELAALGVRVPDGFATTSAAFRDFLAVGGLAGRIYDRLDDLDVDDVEQLQRLGAWIREEILGTPFPQRFQDQIVRAYAGLALSERDSVAVRSSATAEDLPQASFAGQQATFLNVQGVQAVQQAIKRVFASLFSDRAIAYRVHQGFAHRDVALSAGVQRMVRSDLGASGVLFTLDTESGFPDLILITGSYGLGESVVQGTVNPDEFRVYKPALANGREAIVGRTLGSKQSRLVYDAGARDFRDAVRSERVPEPQRRRFCLSDAEVHSLAGYALSIERHYQRPMDIEWARDGLDGRLYILQARPETVQSRPRHGIETYSLLESGKVLCSGRSIGQKIGSGIARVIGKPAEMHRLADGEVLVTDMTDPDWEPVMKRAAAIVTNRGGRTCHAAIIARELGVPAVVGCGDATRSIVDGQPVTVSCAQGDEGFVHAGLLDFRVQRTELGKMPKVPVKMMMNIGNPEQAFRHARLPNHGVGLARLEFIVNRMIGIHPRALLEFADLSPDVQRQISDRISAYGDPVSFYVQRLVEGIATIAAAFSPAPVIVRLSDFKSNEYANLIGGEGYEPVEENPMIGFRGAGRYLDDAFRACFELECRAIAHVRDAMGLVNVELMVPFVRTLSQARAVVDLLAENGLRRGERGLRLIMMCEVPGNALLAEQYLQYFDGFSIGSNDLTQLTLALDRDSGLLAAQFDERDPAVKKLMGMAIDACNRAGKTIGICGQGPSDHPDFATWLVEQGIDSLSLNPDTIVATWLHLSDQHV